MAFLTKIRNLIKQFRNRNFRSSIEREKGKKYLIADRIHTGKRRSWKIFREPGERSSPIARYIREKISINAELRERQEYYLRYIGLFLIGACIYIILYSPYFQISPSKVLIEGLDEGIDISIAYRSIEDLYGENIFFIDEKRIAESLQKYQKNISLIRIDRLYPNNLKILLSGYPILFDVSISTLRDRRWGMTENGVLIPKEKVESPPRYLLTYVDPTITDEVLLDYKELISGSDTQVIKKTIDLFESTWPDIGLDRVSFLVAENELHMKLRNGSRIFFTIEDFTKKTGETPDYNALRMQLLGLKVYIENHHDDIVAGKYVYIDARIPGKIFACREKDPCTKNLSTIYPNLTP